MSTAPLADAKRHAATAHVLREARAFVIAHGLDVTMDQIAETAGVSRSTLFRMFGSRDQVIAEAFAAAFDDYGRTLSGTEAVTDVEAWLRATCEAAHHMNARYGPGYWELTSRTDLPTALAALEHKRRTSSSQLMAGLAEKLWRAHVGTGPVPEALTVAVTAHLSAHFTAAVMSDTGQPWQVASELAREAITAVLQRVSSG